MKEFLWNGIYLSWEGDGGGWLRIGNTCVQLSMNEFNKHAQIIEPYI
jgi:hypothetical protein